VVPNRFLSALRVLRTEWRSSWPSRGWSPRPGGRRFFRAGGQQAILSATSGITGRACSWVPFGTELEVLPIVYGNGQIWLDISPRVTAVSQGLGITVGGASSPGLPSR
jgi:pilus assembly protein CpaC